MWNCGSFIYFLSFFAILIFHVFVKLLLFGGYFEAFIFDRFQSTRDHFDYIVVGSGSAGSIVASRLAEDKNVSVLLLETGGYSNRLLQIPFVGTFLQTTDFDWKYKTVPQKHACQGLKNKVSVWPRGKGIGGTNLLNNMIYTRGHREDFSKWFKDQLGYNYDLDVLPYFQKVESSFYDSKKSIIIADHTPFLTRLSKTVMDAANYLRLPLTSSLHSDIGFSVPKVTIYNAERWSSADQMLRKKSDNLLIQTHSHVQKVLFKNGFEAYGVEYSHFNVKQTVFAARGVIISAGVIETPKLLMLSGIGPKSHLHELGINTLIDLPVGENLQDHVTTGLDLISLTIKPEIGFIEFLSLKSMLQYFLQGDGVWTTNSCEIIAFFEGESQQQCPHLQFMILPYGITVDKGLHVRTFLGVDEHLWENYFAKINQTTFTILPIVLHPKSRGTVKIQSKNFKDPPLINPNYLSESYDVDVLIEGLAKIKEIINTPPLKSLGASIVNIPFPGCDAFSFDTKLYWECYVRQLTLTAYHPVGTCSLGEVVDYDFKVMKSNKLYVVDGSVLPSLPSGNPNSAIMMMAERAADSIKEQWWLQNNFCNISDIFLIELYCLI